MAYNSNNNYLNSIRTKYYSQIICIIGNATYFSHQYIKRTTQCSFLQVQILEIGMLVTFKYFELKKG